MSAVGILLLQQEEDVNREFFLRNSYNLFLQFSYILELHHNFTKTYYYVLTNPHLSHKNLIEKTKI